MDEAKEVISTEVVALTETVMRLPADSPGAKLGAVALRGLDQLERIISLEVPDDAALEVDPMNPDAATVALKKARLIGDMALGAAKLFQRAAEGAFRAQQGNALVGLLEELKALQREKKTD